MMSNTCAICNRKIQSDTDSDWWLHPKAQALLSAKARMSIELDLIRCILDDPNYETTSLDMEYWNNDHDRIVKLQEDFADAKAEIALLRQKLD